MSNFTAEVNTESQTFNVTRFIHITQFYGTAVEGFKETSSHASMHAPSDLSYWAGSICQPDWTVAKQNIQWQNIAAFLLFEL